MICYHDKTFCASPCANYLCDRHETHVPKNASLPVSWGLFHSDCSEFIRVPTTRWKRTESFDAVHIVPVQENGDTVEPHTVSSACPCSPECTGYTEEGRAIFDHRNIDRAGQE